jgi:hypothetical protein
MEPNKDLTDLVKKSEDLAKSQLNGLAKKVDGLFMTDRQIAKKIISIKSKLTDDELNLLVYGKDLKREIGPSYKAFMSENEIMFPDLVSMDKNSPFQPIPLDSPVFDEVKRLKTDMRDNMFLLEQKGKDLNAEVVKLGVIVAATIPAAAIMVAPVSFNIPGATVLTMNLLNGISSVNGKLKDFVPILGKIESLKYVIPDDKMAEVTKPLTTAVDLIKTISDTIGKFKIPGFSTDPDKPSVKEKALLEGRTKMEDLKTKIGGLSLQQFTNYSNPTLALESAKKELESQQEALGKKLESLLK